MDASGSITPGDGSGGATGGVVRRPRGSRSALTFLQQEVERGALLSDDETAASIRFAVNVRDAADSNYRDRLRACELLEAMKSRGVNVAMYLDKMDRAAAGEATEVVQHQVLTIKPPRALGTGDGS